MMALPIIFGMKFVESVAIFVERLFVELIGAFHSLPWRSLGSTKLG